MSQKRMMETALDLLPYGPEEPETGRVGKVPLPEASLPALFFHP